LEDSLTALIESEIQFHLNLESLRKELEYSYDFSTSRIFKAIDESRLGFINESNLRIFLKKMGHQPLKAELLAILRRFDLNGDSKISYSEFKEAVRSSNPDFLPQKDHLVMVPEKKRLSPGKSSRGGDSPEKKEDNPRQYEFRYDRRRPASADKTSGAALQRRKRAAVFQMNKIDSP
jgi:EF-hand domain pair